MTRHRYLLDVLDEGVAFERWSQDGHTEECFEAAEQMHRVVAAQAAGAELDEPLGAARACLDACPLCKVDLADAVALLQGCEAEGSLPRTETAPEPTPTPTPASSPESSSASSRLVGLQRSKQPAPTQPRAQRPAATQSQRSRTPLYALAAVLVACIAGATLAFLWQQSHTHRSTKSGRDKHRASRAGAPGNKTTERPMAGAPSTTMAGASSMDSRPAPRVPVSPRPTPKLAPKLPLKTAMARRPEPKPNPKPKGQKYGYLRINTIPWTKIHIDGQYKGSTPQLKIKLRAGRHKMVLLNSRYGVRFVAHITIHPGKATTFIRHFKTTQRPKPKPNPKGQKYGYLRINTVPHTKIYIDGRYKGLTPQMKIKLRAGQHRMALLNSAHRVSYVHYITIHPNKSTTFIRRFK